MAYAVHPKVKLSEKNNSKKVADAVGFGYKYNEKSKHFAHNAAIFVLSPDGVVSRYLYGIEYRPLDLKLSVLSALKKEQISTVERVFLFCYNYDPQSNSYVLYAVNLMRIAGILTIIIMLISWYFLIKKRQRK